jgi:dihydrofolate reductase
MAAPYTFDVFCTLDGFGSYGSDGGWGGYWGKQGPELLERRRSLFEQEQWMVFGANTFRAFVDMLGSSADTSDVDEWGLLMKQMPATVMSSTLRGPLDWPNATVVSGDPVEIVAQLKQESEAPLRSHGSLSLNRALMTAGLVDFVQVTIFPVISGATGTEPIFQGAADFDLELVESRLLDGRTHELIYRPSLHRAPPQIAVATAAESTAGG